MLHGRLRRRPADRGKLADTFGLRRVQEAMVVTAILPPRWPRQDLTDGRPVSPVFLAWLIAVILRVARLGGVLAVERARTRSACDGPRRVGPLYTVYARM